MLKSPSRASATRLQFLEKDLDLGAYSHARDEVDYVPIVAAMGNEYLCHTRVLGAWLRPEFNADRRPKNLEGFHRGSTGSTSLAVLSFRLYMWARGKSNQGPR